WRRAPWRRRIPWRWPAWRVQQRPSAATAHGLPALCWPSWPTSTWWWTVTWHTYCGSHRAWSSSRRLPRRCSSSRRRPWRISWRTKWRRPQRRIPRSWRLL
ncbi:hypothetical protein GGI13_001519, partial [Coemansia sp. RSA 455]